MGFGARTGISNTLMKDYCSLLHVSPFDCLWDSVKGNRGRGALCRFLPTDTNPGDCRAMKFVFKVRCCQIAAEFPFTIRRETEVRNNMHKH